MHSATTVDFESHDLLRDALRVLNAFSISRSVLCGHFLLEVFHQLFRQPYSPGGRR